MPESGAPVTTTRPPDLAASRTRASSWRSQSLDTYGGNGDSPGSRRVRRTPSAIGSAVSSCGHSETGGKEEECGVCA
ncbi:hypothetical protein ACH4N4_16080 [Streptomyces microflavus]|uniref:hypothetical protein n=1 Tax=Streptomyces microflavus TaxID=1919 RepID=UPI003790300F